MRLLLAAAAFLLSAVFAVGQTRDFDARALTYEEVRLLQAGLSFAGAYLGRIDGDWGARSDRAVRTAAGPAPDESAVRDILIPFIEDVSAARWDAFNPSGTSALLPMGLLSAEEGEDFYELRTGDRGLVIRYIFRPGPETGAMHAWLEAEHVGAEPFYRADTEEAYISGGEIASGKRIYLRTIRVADVLETVLVQWDPSEAPRARVVVASLANGSVGPLVLPQDGYLARILFGLAGDDGPARAAGSTESGPPAAPSVIGTGTGFYVNGTDIVTGAHVVDGCDRLTLADGSALLVLRTDTETDLAVLRAAQRSADWLDLASGASDRLGAPVVALGFPFAGLFDQGLSATRGNISALRGIDGSETAFTITAPVQPGNSGGPLLDMEGRVVGVVSYRASDDFIRERSGTVAQNLNGGTRLKPLRQFLGAAGVMLPAPSGEPRDISAGLAEALTRAVVMIECHADR
ncbi:S1 family peptidase [Jannaschia seohaensis]|uniref:Trypsin-like peptidase n=1 Tax=Jannaschia seohaensis TaxID=475081 RepID=A0A2Y9A731_9RHOB|nr:serine protease [Jannaschia seohaensis]PWJ22121.1 trypsin-like peptidase [Jannaschia seohaensis]SSA38399.1 Trypsin-like peptidase domain-containing protein [Jannaschia seohaensis]